VTVNDTIAPAISGCPANITVSTGAGRMTCDQTATWTQPTATDNCDGPVAYFSRSHAPGAAFPVGTTTVSYVFKDAAGNSSTCSFTVTVNDTTPPAITGTIATTTVEGCNTSAAPAAATTVAQLEAMGLSISDNCTSDAVLVVSHADVANGTC